MSSLNNLPNELSKVYVYKPVLYLNESVEWTFWPCCPPCDCSMLSDLLLILVLIRLDCYFCTILSASLIIVCYTFYQVNLRTVVMNLTLRHLK